MKYRTMHYPGDPPMEIKLMTGAEFKEKIRGGKPGFITTGHLKPGTFELDRETASTIEFDEVVCDTCNAEIKDEDFLAMDRSRAVCKACYDAHWKAYVS